MKGNLVVISGGTKGIGKALVEVFASRGFDISICSRNKGDLQKVKEEIENKFSVSVHTKTADVSIKKEVHGYAEDILKLNRTVDVLINNAGIFIPGKITEEEDGVFESLMYTNLFSTYYLTKALMPAIKKAENGHIFNVCSTAGIMAYSNGGSYSISKYGMIGFSKGIREELKEEGIKVTTVIPGATFTRSWEAAGIAEERFMSVTQVAKSISDCQSLDPSTVVEEILLRPMLGDI